MRLQKDHDLPDFLLLGPGPFDHFDSFSADTLYFRQPIHLLLDHLKGFLAEFFHNPFGHYRADALDKPGTQIFSNAIDGSRDLRMVVGYLELLAVSGVMHPFALHGDDLPHRRGRYVSHHGHQSSVAIHLYLGDGEAGLHAGVGDFLYLAFEFGEHFLEALSH